MSAKLGILKFCISLCNQSKLTFPFKGGLYSKGIDTQLIFMVLQGMI